MHKSGHGRNEIARLLTEQGLHVSEGSVGNIVRAYRQHELPLKSDATISTGVDMNNTGSTSSNAQLGVGKSTTSYNVVTPKNGGSLSHLLVNMTDSPIEPTLSITNSVTPTNSEELDFSDNPYPESYPNADSHVDNMQVNIESDIDDKYVIKETEEIEEASEESNQPQSSIRNSENQSTLGIDWDLEENHQRRFWARVMDEKRERRQELQLIERRQQEVDEQKSQMENIRQDLEARENKLRSVEDLIPSAKYLKDNGIGFDQALVWIDCIKEVAQKEWIDERTAAWKLADMLRSFKDLCGLENAIQQTRQQLAMLNMVNDQQKRAITTLAHLQQSGMTEDEIGELVKLVGRWNGTGVGVGQGNGGFKLDDRLIGVRH